MGRVKNKVRKILPVKAMNSHSHKLWRGYNKKYLYSELSNFGRYIYLKKDARENHSFLCSLTMQKRLLKLE